MLLLEHPQRLSGERKLKIVETIRQQEYTECDTLSLYLWRTHMNFVPSSEKAKEWGITQCRVAIWCKEGRVLGAELIGNRWLLPTNAKKLENLRKLRKGETE